VSELISTNFDIKVSNLQGRKAQIVKVAAGLFVKQGYLKTSIRQIAHGCGISMGTLYNYIHSKDDILSLFQEVTMSLLENAAKVLTPTLEQMPPADALKYAIKEYLRSIDEYQDIVVFWYQEAKNLQPNHLVKLFQLEEFNAELFKKLLMRGCEAGKFKIGDLTLASHTIVVLCDMWAFRRWFLRKYYTLEQYTQELTALIFSGISNTWSK